MRMILKMAALPTLLLAACSTASSGDASRIVVSSWAVADLTRSIVGERFEVEDVTPPGVEPHDLELTAADLTAISNAAAVVHLGSSFQPALGSAVPEESSVDISAMVEGDDADPHVWLDPVIWAGVAEALGEELAERMDAPDLVEAGRQHAQAIRRLHASFEAGLESCEHTLVISEHAAFGHLASRYGLENAALTGTTPEAEATAATVEELADLADRSGAEVVYAEPGSAKRLAAALADHADLRVEELDPLELGSLEGDYVSRMMSNLEALRSGLGCA